MTEVAAASVAVELPIYMYNMTNYRQNSAPIANDRVLERCVSTCFSLNISSMWSIMSSFFACRYELSPPPISS